METSTRSSEPTFFICRSCGLYAVRLQQNLDGSPEVTPMYDHNAETGECPHRSRPIQIQPGVGQEHVYHSNGNVTFYYTSGATAPPAVEEVTRPSYAQWMMILDETSIDWEYPRLAQLAAVMESGKTLPLTGLYWADA